MSDSSDLNDVNLVERARDGVRASLEQGFGGFSQVRVFTDGLLEPQVISGRSGQEVLVSWVFEGTNDGEFQGMAPTGQRVRVEGITIVQPNGTKFNGRWLMDEVNLYRQLGHVIPTPRPIDFDSLESVEVPDGEREGLQPL